MATFRFKRGHAPADFIKKLRRFEEVLADRLEEALERAVLIVQATAQRLVPVDTGRLRASIESAVKRIGDTIVRGFVGTNVEYAPHVEIGTGSMDAQPYLRPAVEAHRPDIRNQFERAFRETKAEVARA